MERFWTFIFLFALYSFLGWVCESLFCSIPAGRFINRGFLTGPFCPVYGFGALLVITVLQPFQDQIPVLFLVAVALTSTLEYLTGLVLETLFHAKYWDYSQNRFNFQGRVCLQNSILFGVMSVATVQVLHPAVLTVISWMPPRALPVVSICILAYFSLDTGLTVFEMFRLNGKLSELQQVLDEIRERAAVAKEETLEAIQDTFALKLDEASRLSVTMLFERKERLESGFHLMQRRILRAFPTMQSIRNRDSLQRTRELLQNKAKKMRKK